MSTPPVKENFFITFSSHKQLRTVSWFSDKKKIVKNNKFFLLQIRNRKFDRTSMNHVFL